MRNLILFAIIPVIMIGCSQQADKTVLPNEKEIGNSISNSWGHYQINYNENDSRFEVVSLDDVDRTAAFDVTPYAQFGITSAVWNPSTRNWTIGVWVKNPSPFTAYGVWVVFTKLGDKELVNHDGFTYHWNGTSFNRVPFIALGKSQAQRQFPPQHREDFTVIIHWPDNVNNWYPIQFIIDVSWPNPRLTPMVENLESGNDSAPNPTYFISAKVTDFQDASNTLTVYADLSPVGLPAYVPMFDDGLHHDGIAGDSIFGITGQIAAPASDYEITVHAVDPTKHKMENDVTLTILEPQPWIDITRPDGGEIFNVGSDKLITWTSSGIPGNVSILYSKDNFVSDFHLLEVNEPNDGSYLWENIPNEPSTTVKVRVCSVDLPGGVCGTSDNYFTIYYPPIPKITVTVPNGGEDWEVGSDRAIRWTSEFVPGTVKIEYSKDNFASDIHLIASNVTNDGSHMWNDIPNDRSTTVKIRITANDIPSVFDTSDNYFKISSVSSQPCRGFIKLREGTRPMYDYPGERVIRTQQEWQSFLATFPWPNPPTIDFEVDMVIGLFMGEMMHGGFWFQVNSICEDPWNRLVVDYYKWYPGPNCGYPDVINWPHYIFKCEKTNEEVLFEWVWKEDPCKP